MQLRVVAVTAYCYVRVVGMLPHQPGDTVILMWGSRGKACWREFWHTTQCSFGRNQRIGWRWCFCSRRIRPR